MPTAGVTARRGFGVAGALSPDVVQALAPAAEEAGYATFWTNDTPDGEGLVLLQVAAQHTSTIRLGVGLMPLDRWTPERIIRRVGELGLPVDRLTVGVGAGGARGGVELVREGVAALRRSLAATIVVGALGPTMRRLAGELGDGVMFDWVTPSCARAAAVEVEQGALAARRRRPSVAAYVFTALGEPARSRLRAEAQHYGSVPSYAAHFARMGFGPLEAGVGADTPADLRAALTAFDGALDETIVRAVTGKDEAEAYMEVLAVASPSG